MNKCYHAKLNHGSPHLIIYCLVGMAVLAVSFASGAQAKPARTVWSTYWRTGPSTGAPVIAELEHDTPLELDRCDGQWCRVSLEGQPGYILRDAIDLPRLVTAQPAGQAPGPCFVAGQTSYHGLAATRFCAVSGAAKPGG
jgi:hypothetical protein